eukprot:3477300-Rhodomonas_salina.1
MAHFVHEMMISPSHTSGCNHEHEHNHDDDHASGRGEPSLCAAPGSRRLSLKLARGHVTPEA